MSAKKTEDLELIRSVLEELTAKWALLVLNVLCDGPARFNALKRANPGISQKALTQCLRRLEAAGLILRTVVSTAPVAVVYEVTPLGASLEPHTSGILDWSLRNREAILAARQASRGREGRDSL
ncbi:DNA-binding HxlR family transcriptional regulator [Novosphingobium chloroacetimidivorans]|uniref:DNA-binding HxlR family transcriptional regulator n=1 Tax=Novosphingobium chloroacetimidivorans TaxID=1428314 RepID=A0A7W7K9Z1_9SPHN|nr:helix-turn-helix domain-containing protein [Novosphingobium chloroacetimidivorans]MBB4858720.1 DNA-binding HxlR family transcriptional regulator [Novosphingobium chloroacetimidivorans]